MQQCLKTTSSIFKIKHRSLNGIVAGVLCSGTDFNLTFRGYKDTTSHLRELIRLPDTDSNARHAQPANVKGGLKPKSLNPPLCYQTM